MVKLRERQRGLIYLAMLFAVAVMGIGLASTGTLWSQVSRREKERQLLEIGHAYRDAIRRYYENSPGTVLRYPSTLDELLLDPRHLGVERYLRKRYGDPITGSSEWGLVRAPDGGIMGVHSLSGRVPLKSGGFRNVDAAFVSAATYADWHFVFIPESARQ
ncbi:type II secretion system protein [Sinimarinibacterium flocculans]|uniref:type II secretion system protein n=1 Tax=Sinimarinibacterium flocculans TaxID=985250 RepID=UPI003511B783